MRPFQIASAVLALSLSMPLAGGAARAQAPADPPIIRPDAGRTTGEKIGGVVDRARAGLRDTAESLRDQFSKARGSVHAMGVQSRLYSRLHWDKSLQNVEFDLQVTREGAATLRGAVPDVASKSRAVELARETVGITQVYDELIVGSTGASTTTTTITPAGTTRTTTTTTKTVTPAPIK